MGLEVGQIIDGKYRIVRLIGEGGMGAVYEEEHTVIRRRVAIKVLHAHAALQPGTVQRFEREAQAAGRIGSDHILEVLDLGTLPSNERYIVLEYLDGETLAARIARLGRVTAEELAGLAVQLLSGLAAAHQAGIIHRDLKPENVFILKEKAGQRDFVKIIDFGVSKFNQASGDMSMTRTGSVLGTPYYMSPEQASGSREADARSDVYAVGVILFEALTGKVPFDANTFNELLFKIVLAEPPKVSELAPNTDPAFAALVEKAMAREPAFRFQTAGELADALRAWQLRGVHAPAPAASPLGTVVASPPAATAVLPPAQFATSAPALDPPSAAELPAARSGRGPRIAAVLVGALVVVVALAALLARSRRSSDDSSSASSPSSVASVGQAAPSPDEPSGASERVRVAPAAQPEQAPASSPAVAASEPAPAEPVRPARPSKAAGSAKAPPKRQNEPKRTAPAATQHPVDFGY